MRVVFSKLSDRRLPQYQIQTYITLDHGERNVYKRALHSDAAGHIRKMADSRRLLTGVGFHCCSIAPDGEDTVRFGYAQGPSLTRELLHAGEDQGKFSDLLDLYAAFIRGAPENVCPFEQTPAFEALFGDARRLAGSPALRVSDIDANPDNIIHTENGYMLTDYEWVYDFPIPINFILYRNLKEFCLKHNDTLIKSLPFCHALRRFGIETRQRALLEAMDQRFSAMVHGIGGNDEKRNYRQATFFADTDKDGTVLGPLIREVERLNKEQAEHHQRAMSQIDRLNECLEDTRSSLEDQLRRSDLRCAKYGAELEGILASRSWIALQKASAIKKRIRRPFSKCDDIVPGVIRSIKTQRRYETLLAPECAEPLVSIIIPAYNQFGFTYHCIQSVIEHTQGIPYEIIVADDVSKDRTKNILKYVKNITVIRNDKNLGFLLNCNHAAAFAKGRYIHFLNNDTEVRDNWLPPLVDLFIKNAETGLAGSKLIGADGLLQEAGGIVWKDATGWNYGLGEDPALPEYNYVKEADYISGASMMIAKKLWEEIGGFDGRFAPAYFEDTDLAFEVRRRGYKVFYQPLSEVVHFEGISNGTDEGSGIKKYQAVNRGRFLEKWADELKETHFENAQDVFWARDRSRGKRTILVAAHYVPHFDKDAGSRAVFLYLQLFLDLGMNVKFIGDNFYKHEPYTTVLEQMGVEVLYGETYAHSGWKRWVDKNAAYIDVAFLNRPHIAGNYIGYLQRHTDAKIVYFGHDLHFLREMREYEYDRDDARLQSARDWKEKEENLMHRADRVVTLSTEEKRIIRDTFHLEADLIPIFYFRDFQAGRADYSKKKDLLFVGGFAHRPNADGLKWFVSEVFPQIRQSVLGVRLHVVGSNPDETILGLACDDILVHGFVSDEDLERYYRDCRVCVVPLRFGAGVKGKTVEAMYHQISIVSTEIGIEGLPDITDVIEPENDADGFASQVIRKYGDEAALRADGANYLSYMKRRFSYESAYRTFARILASGGSE